ncbi:23S rRNA (pseudouridine(1915)-N(3))-methyltransferase RlmH [Candidatus Uhrbacteria bacterium]|nr:23S rRNA (pseudouridine(1915)-N(3))-methyltransferase RlmH [Candidatus Uhrbacteria bacterium]
MYPIKILAVGGIKSDYFREAIAEYSKRLKPLAKLEIVELEPEPFTDDRQKAQSVRLEERRVMEYLENHRQDEVILLDKSGEQLSSEQLAKRLEAIARPIVFVIGGTLGFGQELLSVAHKKLSLSKLTLTHEMARLLLLEQVYRSATIIKNIKYHY